ncbi:asparagine synthase (glutamine-hydrolyzing) [Desulfosediminicola flagellatus]|uniref:asparagine synthase (glutamine-hydrolyzing) n=1 Tax=Desulfosediminicola flagellatus TaxID=2569541 RepID=UPI0010ACB489|nr:asparagine synthase (glutamine-hydrolyzing) [Desulfosediminicola flagellatus]
MCGIGGYQLRPSTDEQCGELLGIVREMLNHRGPDANGSWQSEDKQTGLAHTRLAIVDLSSAAAQPMCSVDGLLAVTFNGEIYNWRELRKELLQSGAIFQTQSDTEVLLHGYIHWGRELLQRLRGMYAFALFDFKQSILFCARDKIGKKPFIYSLSEQGFFFSSEIPPLLTMADTVGIDTSIDQTGLANMLLHNIRHIPEPLTGIKGIKKLRPGHALIVKNGVIQEHWRHWRPEQRKSTTAGELLGLLEDAVAVRSMADVPVGALLSGGVDSTAIVALMQKTVGQPVNTYAFGVNPADEDLRRARFAAKHLGTTHEEFYFNPDCQFEIFKSMLVTYGEPFMLLPLIHAYQLSEAIHADGIKVVLNGNGADELFYGYTGHLRTARVSHVLNRIGWLRHVLPENRHPVLSVLGAKPGMRKATMYQRKAESCWPRVMQDDVVNTLEHAASTEMAAWGELLPHHDFIDESNYVSLLVENTHSLTLASDLPAMMASVEMRSPFLDQEVIAAAMGIHFTDKVHGPADGSGLKKILRTAVSGLVPPELLNAPKRGFGMGVQEKDVLLGPWWSHANELFHEYPEMGMFDSAKIQDMWTSALLKKTGQWDLLAKLFGIGLWARGMQYQ